MRYLEDERAEVHTVVVGHLHTNVWVLRCRATGRAVLIDAADDPRQLVALARSLGVEQVLETHGHLDHIAAVPGMREAGFPVGIAEPDGHHLEYDFEVRDGDVFEVGDLRLAAIATPGHTAGSTCYLLEESGILFAGDTLFPGGPGATRPATGGNFATIIRSIEERLFILHGDTRVLPGHGKATTIGAERPHLAEWIERGW